MAAAEAVVGPAAEEAAAQRSHRRWARRSTRRTAERHIPEAARTRTSCCCKHGRVVVDGEERLRYRGYALRRVP